MNEPSIGPQIEGLTFMEHLGSGGYSEVYLYEQRRPKMRVAVKVLTDNRLSEAELSRFADEAETMAELADHPFIVQVFRTGVTDDGRPYLVMKYYPPPNLGTRAATQRLTVAEVLRTGIQISSAVETAHRAGILHRDIKPANILVSQFGSPGLADFGIAGKAAETDSDDDLGVSIPWSPPEIISGSSNGSVRSDVYSLAATLWHLLAGRSPFEVPSGGDNSPRALIGRIHRVAAPATGRADAPTSLDRLLQQAMSKDPKMRQASALEFARQLQAVEQELRYVSTQIVVDGDRGPRPVTPEEARGDLASADEASGTAYAVWAPPVDRAELRPRAEPSTTLRPLRATTPAPEPRPTPAGAAAAKAEPPTTLRPARPPEAAIQPPSQVAPQPIPAPGIEGGTRRRPTAAQSGTQPTGVTVEESPATTVRPASPTTKPDLTPPPVRRRSKAVIVLIGSVASIVALVVAVVLLGGSHTPRLAASQTAPTPLGTDGGGFGPATVAKPTVKVSYQPVSHTLTFRWSVRGGRSGQYYTYAVNGNPPKETTATSTSVKTSTPRKTCITVGSVSSDGTTNLARQVCG